jgi:hypothetical protein
MISSQLWKKTAEFSLYSNQKRGTASCPNPTPPATPAQGLMPSIGLDALSKRSHESDNYENSD